VRLSRFFWFLVCILIGAAAGLVIGWYLKPVAMGDVKPSALRSDYRTDYVLMVAEVFDSEKDLSRAAQRLAYLGSDSPVRLAQAAILRAGELSYDQRDLEMLAHLAQAFQSGPSTASTPAAGVTAAPTSQATPAASPTAGAKP
jgi:hypothetical protein